MVLQLRSASLNKMQGRRDAKKPITIEDIVKIAYADEIAAENKRKERMTRK